MGDRHLKFHTERDNLVTVNGHPLTSWPAVLWQRALAYRATTEAEIGPLRHDGFSCSFVGSH
jgi:hypothetical protein